METKLPTAAKKNAPTPSMRGKVFGVFMYEKNISIETIVNNEK